MPFTMVDDVLASGAGAGPDPGLPSRVVVYLLLAASLFAECGYRQVWARFTAGLNGLPAPLP